MPRNQHWRRFCFTWNNYPENAEAALRRFFDEKTPTYMIVGKEVGESGTRHLQGYIHLKERMSFNRLKERFPTVHFEQAKGNAEQNKTYCSKEQDFFEMGTCPKGAGKASKESWKDILDAAEKGNWSFLKENYPRVWVTMSEKLISKRIPATTTICGDLQNEWWFGATGTGKSKLAWEKYGVICYQKMLNKWWDGYDAQPVVIIEEWSPKNEVTASALKIWADRYPFTAQIKGGVLQKIRPAKLIVISNYPLDECFPDSRDAEPLRRRFKQFEFPNDSTWVSMNADAFLERLQAESESQADELETQLGSETSLDVLIPTPPSSPTHGISLASSPSENWLDYASIADFNRYLEFHASGSLL